MIPIAYYFVLPRPAAFANLDLPTAYDDESIGAPPTTPYTPLPTSDDPEEDGLVMEPKRSVALSARDKWVLVKPLMVVYMLPLCKSVTVSAVALTHQWFTVVVYTVSLPIYFCCTIS